MKLTDGKKTVEIELQEWNEENGCYGIDFSNEFYNAGSLAYDDELDAYIVSDVDYCIDYAMDWKKSIGDFNGEEYNENRTVFVDGVAQ